MKIAFYAPMKSPYYHVPSGDRYIGQLLWKALELGGHDVFLASQFRTYDGKGDQLKQNSLLEKGRHLASTLIKKFELDPPDLWFSYHLYHKAPDLLGPAVCSKLKIPYVLAEASYAAKQKDGAHAQLLDISKKAIKQAHAILSFVPEDEEGLRSIVRDGSRLYRLDPFIEFTAFTKAKDRKVELREIISAKYGIDTKLPWLLTVAMMRSGDKFNSYSLLSQSLKLLKNEQWQLIVVGDGIAYETVKLMLKKVSENQIFLIGQKPQDSLPEIYAASDLLVWPAVNEAYGMTFLEAAASGLPVIAGDNRGVSQIVENNITGKLIKPWHNTKFADAVLQLIRDPKKRAAMGEAAQQRVQSKHSMNRAAEIISKALIDSVNRSSREVQ